MDVVTLSRIQFGVTTALHFLFVPLTLGLIWFVAIFQTMYYRTGEERWRRMAKSLSEIPAARWVSMVG